jgi:hypothetical protein
MESQGELETFKSERTEREQQAVRRRALYLSSLFARPRVTKFGPTPRAGLEKQRLDHGPTDPRPKSAHVCKCPI